MSASGRDFDVRLATDADVDAVLAALSDGYGRPFTREWFDWKHRESPWGASQCFIAEDEGGLLGTAFKMPWHFSEGGDSLPGWRLVDGATTVRAQRRGVFRAVVAGMLAECDRAAEKGVALATATPEARLAHIKNGAAALDPIRAYYSPVRWSRAEVVTGVDVLASWTPPVGEGISTVWDVPALQWRLDQRSGIKYEVSRLAKASSPHGVIHRTVGRGARTLVVTASWGDRDEVRRLIRTLAWQSRVIATLLNAGDGTSRHRPRLALARGQSLMCVWDQRSIAEGTDIRRGWALDGLDLEGAI